MPTTVHLAVAQTRLSIPIIAEAPPAAQMRFMEFFAANIRNPNTRRAYARAAHDCLAWCAGQGVRTLADILPLHIAAWVETSAATLSAKPIRCCPLPRKT